MRRENARQLITHAFTYNLRPTVLPIMTAILPNGPYLSSYEAVRTKAAGSWRELSHSESLRRLPLRLNWFVLLISSKALTSRGSVPKPKVITASDLSRKSPEPSPPDSLNVEATRMLSCLIMSSEETLPFPKQSRSFLRRFQIAW